MPARECVQSRPSWARWRHVKAGAWAGPSRTLWPGRGDESELLGIIRAVSPAPCGLPGWLQQSPPHCPFPSLSGPLASFGLTLDGYCSLGDLWGVVDPAGLGLSPSLAFLPVCLEAGHLTL